MLQSSAYHDDGSFVLYDLASTNFLKSATVHRSKPVEFYRIERAKKSAIDTPTV